jgi:hypothetical protein
MSFGVSPGDPVMLLKWLRRISNTLKHEAMDSFRRCVRTYKGFAELLKHMSEVVGSTANLQSNPFVMSTLRRTEKKLQEYLSKVDEFRPYLERKKNRKRRKEGRMKEAKPKVERGKGSTKRIPSHGGDVRPPKSNGRCMPAHLSSSARTYRSSSTHWRRSSTCQGACWYPSRILPHHEVLTQTLIQSVKTQRESTRRVSGTCEHASSQQVHSWGCLPQVSVGGVQ